MCLVFTRQSRLWRYSFRDISHRFKNVQVSGLNLILYSMKMTRHTAIPCQQQGILHTPQLNCRLQLTKQTELLLVGIDRITMVHDLMKF